MADPCAPRLLFVPVSGPFGMGEYARSLSIAHAARSRWPAVAIHFAVSREAPYAAKVPYPATLLPASPTFHSGEVIGLIERFKPDVTLFDNAGRTAQLSAARRVGRVVFISARPRQRRKAFRLKWMRLLDEHWIAYPKLLAGELGALERFKLAWLRRPNVRYLDVILPAAAEGQVPIPGDYALFVPGGGTGHPGAINAMPEFTKAAESLARGGIITLLAGGPVASVVPGLRALGTLPQAELIGLMRGARLIIANGGSTLLQGLACGVACIGVPIANDQRERVARCVAAGVVVAAELKAADMLLQARALWDHPGELAALAKRAAEMHLADGLGIAIEALEGLCRTPS